MTATGIGRVAAQVAAHGGDAQVIGVTSRGIFLALDRRVLFISFERWRGPLTINVDGPLACILGEPARLSASRLIFSATEIDLSTAAVWQPAAPPFARSMVVQREALKQLTSNVLARKAPDGFGVLLPHLLDLPEKQALSTSEAALLARLNQVRAAIQHGAFDRATTLIEGLLGLGRGLTPSGDDVTIGLLLALTRVQGKHPERSGRRPPTSLRSAHAERAPAAQSKDASAAFKQRVVESAYQRTTTISANLIECAANGDADERLINVLNGLITGQPTIAECAEHVLDWGNSSGIDALIGMALTLSDV